MSRSPSLGCGDGDVFHTDTAAPGGGGNRSRRRGAQDREGALTEARDTQGWAEWTFWAALGGAIAAVVGAAAVVFALFTRAR